MMDYITAHQGQPNYVASFLIADILLFISFVCALKIDMDLELPVNKDAMGGLRAILTNFEILLFLVMMFVCGSMYGFVETFLFVFLKEDLHAPMYLLGLTITTGAVVSLPFLYYSDTVVKKVGCHGIIAIALLMYGVRYVGYSYIQCDWYAFPFEALEVLLFASGWSSRICTSSRASRNARDCHRPAGRRPQRPGQGLRRPAGRLHHRVHQEHPSRFLELRSRCLPGRSHLLPLRPHHVGEEEGDGRDQRGSSRDSQGFKDGGTGGRKFPDSCSCSFSRFGKEVVGQRCGNN